MKTKYENDEKYCNIIKAIDVGLKIPGYSFEHSAKKLIPSLLEFDILSALKEEDSRGFTQG